MGATITEYTRPATFEDLKTVVRYLNEAGVDYLLVGGYALAAHGLPRMTTDIDILVDPAPANTRRWILALSRLPDRAAAELTDDPTVFAAGEDRYAIRINDVITIDVMPTICGHSWQDMQGYRTTTDLDGLSIAVLNLDGLLRTKTGVREQDRRDVALIRQAIALFKSPPHPEAESQ